MKRIANSAFARERIDLDHPPTWPEELCAFLEEHHELFLRWETKQGSVLAQTFDEAIVRTFDEAIVRLANLLRPYEIVGWHCTRLTDEEIEEISCNGMGLPDGRMLTRRINAVEEAGCLAPDVARILKLRNQADEEYRAGAVWFCFYPPGRAGEHGIERFFRHWGGEALYNSHERDPVTSQAISCIGTPCLVEANVPIAFLARHGGLELNFVRRFLVGRGLPARLVEDYEGRIVSPLPAANVRRVVLFPDPDFLELTGCSDWASPIPS